MSMSKKHFEALAAALFDHRVGRCFGPEQSAEYLTWRAICFDVTDVCARFNPNFDRTRFLKACGVEEGK